MAKINDISDADRDLFRNSVGPVQRVRKDVLPNRKSRPAPFPVQRDVNLHISTGKMSSAAPAYDLRLASDELLFKQPGIQNRVMEKLRKGKFVIERELDLHGMLSKDAQAALGRFLSHCQQHDCRYVRIIHGKGRGSKDGKPVIKTRLAAWLRDCPQVLAYCSARAGDGGTGAVYVMLKNNQ